MLYDVYNVYEVPVVGGRHPLSARMKVPECSIRRKHCT